MVSPKLLEAVYCVLRPIYDSGAISQIPPFQMQLVCPQSLSISIGPQFEQSSNLWSPCVQLQGMKIPILGPPHKRDPQLSTQRSLNSLNSPCNSYLPVRQTRTSTWACCFGVKGHHYEYLGGLVIRSIFILPPPYYLVGL